MTQLEGEWSSYRTVILIGRHFAIIQIIDKTYETMKFSLESFLQGFLVK